MESAKPRNPFRIHKEINKAQTPFDLLSKPASKPLNPFKSNTQIHKTPKKTIKFFDLVQSNDISRTSEYALDLNSKAIKKQKRDLEQVEIDEDDDKENIPPSRLLDLSRKRTDAGVELQEVPLDWSIKTKTTIISKFSFDWLNIKPNEDTCALSAFARDQPSENDALLLQEYLCRWEYQERFHTTFAPMIAKLLEKEKAKLRLTDLEMADLQYFKEKEQKWKISFRSAYRMVRNGESPLLIYINTSFGVIFENRDGAITACMTKSSFGIRTMLREQDIDFEAVDGTDLECETKQKTVDDDLITRETTYIGYKGGLLFSSKRATHALFDFLLNWTDGRLNVRCAGSPTLFSPKPFIGASLQQATIAKSTVKAKDTKSNLYKISINGPIIPASMRDMLNMIRLKQTRLEETDCLVVFETDQITVIKESTCFKTIEFKNENIIASKIY